MSANSDPTARSQRATETLIASAALPSAVTGALSQGQGSSSPLGDNNNATQAAAVGGWNVLCLCEITNFIGMRRHLGRARADRLAADTAQIVAHACPEARVSPVGRTLIEVAFVREGPDAASAAIAAIQRVFTESIDVFGESLTVNVVFGAAMSPRDKDDDVRLAEAAEAALEQARTEGRIVMLDLSRADQAFDRLTLMRELPRAIAAGEMFLQYQPKVHVRRQAVASAEALVRWKHPTRGLIMPGDFISAAEETGDIGPLTLCLLRQVIADQQKLVAAGHDFPVFINISGVSLADVHFVEEVCGIITDSRAKIGFEITETSVIRDPEVAIRHLQRFAAIGVTLAIDDYGAGLSSLAYLKQLPAAELKIDKMFVMQLTSSNRDPLIVRSTIDLAHALEMEVTAEGVETPSALALLSVMGCDMVQGYLISRPLNFDAFQQFLANEAHLVAAPVPHSSFSRPDAFWKRA